MSEKPELIKMSGIVYEGENYVLEKDCRKNVNLVLGVRAADKAAIRELVDGLRWYADADDKQRSSDAGNYAKSLIDKHKGPDMPKSEIEKLFPKVVGLLQEVVNDVEITRPTFNGLPTQIRNYLVEKIKSAIDEAKKAMGEV